VYSTIENAELPIDPDRKTIEKGEIQSLVRWSQLTRGSPAPHRALYEGGGYLRVTPPRSGNMPSHFDRRELGFSLRNDT